MTRCEEFYEKWESVPNWCEKCPEAVRLINNYLDLVDELARQGVDKDTTNVGFSEGAARPLIREKDAEIKALAISEVAHMLKSQKKRSELRLKPKRFTNKDSATLLKKISESVKQKREWEAQSEETIKPEIKAPKPMAVTVKKSNAKFNFTNDNIEWAQWTWNPVRGCKHDCDYCYARDIANRYEGNFDPAFYADRLAAPYNTALNDEQKARREAGEFTLGLVFVCSMADLFGEWVPDEWINAVLKVCGDTPQWTYLFLTKNPKRLSSFDFPANCWVGTTIDVQKRVKPAEDAMRNVNAAVKFVSCEPLLEPLTFSDIQVFDWIIIGGCSKTTRHAEFQPQWKWISNIMRQAQCNGKNIPVYFKPNLKTRPMDFPRW